MSRKNADDSGISRRNVLRASAGTTSAAVGVAGLSELVTAHDTNENKLTEIERIPEVRSILGELGYEELPQPDSAETVELEYDSIVASVTVIDFGYGELHVGEADGQVVATFHFDANGSSITTGQHKPIKKYQKIPDGTQAWLEGSVTGTKFYRTTTKDEREYALSRLSLENKEDASVYATGRANSFYIDVPRSSIAGNPSEPIGDVARANTNAPQSADNGDIIRYKVTPTGTSIASIRSAGTSHGANDVGTMIISNPIKKAAEKVARNIIKTLGWESADQVDDSCGSKVGGCLDGILSTLDCLKCKPICLGSPTGIGAVLCIACVMVSCSQALNTKSCALAVNCIENR
ncbi:hypothetical protein Halru_2491 [Halovivax ruber XH-70]|uniref:Uncharacterized protein n=1 Tax=Halovivax ruber (strain DSM 18193 / JCM 13892 / XH-70) TaxID=797302 RepID=L0IE09_HALRX|nr:hypothetical protein [Halovivax ruber]AGB17073.1 hypothetical protein Halru_2491 [Halovivax ruber XH-70]